MFVERVAIRSPFFMPETQKKVQKKCKIFAFLYCQFKTFSYICSANKVINLNTLSYEY